MITPTQLSFFAAAMLGHFVGDYLFQNQWMAIGKSGKGWHGHLCCTVHVLLYTFAVALFTGWHPLFLLAVAAPHWIIDRFSLATYILRLKNGFWPFTETWQASPLVPTDPKQEETILITNVWRVAFAASVYIFNDNTLHWVCLWFTCMWLFK